MSSNYFNRTYNQNSRYSLLKFFTAAYLIFAPLTASAAGDLCSGIFKASEATVSEISALSKKPEIKRTTRLDDEAQLLRRYILESGVVDTTKLRSEFKHYVESSRTDEMIRQLEVRFGPQFSIEGKQISGIASRDGMVKLNTKDLKALPLLAELSFGSSTYDRIVSAGLMTAIKNPLVYSQHRETLRSRLFRIVGHVKVDVLMKQIEELHIRAAIDAAGRGLNTYTDTASTAKFAYRSGVSREAILEASSELGLTLRAPEIEILEKVDFSNLSDRQSAEVATSLAKLGIEAEAATNFVSVLRERALDEGVVRYRKYRTGDENLRFDGIASPGAKQTALNNTINDAWFADGVTWLEFKMKNTQGQASRGTVVNKPRFPLPDDVISVLKDANRFKTKEEFELTKIELKQAIRETVDKLLASGIKEASWNEAELNAAIDFIKSLHLQGHSLEPVGRTVYMRKSYNLNLLDKAGNTNNIQITRDRHVWELGRTTGNLLQALPYLAKAQDWHFQYNSQTGMYEHLSIDKKQVLHRFHPRAPKLIYEISGAQEKLVDVRVEPVEVVEIKVPLKFIKLSDEDIANLPDLGAVASLRDQMKYATQDLNTRRRNANLSGFAVDKGKRSSSRNDVAGGIDLVVQGKKVGFKFHPETGYWVSWANKGNLVYHPTVGVSRLSLSEDNKLMSEPIDFRNYSPAGSFQK